MQTPDTLQRIEPLALCRNWDDLRKRLPEVVPVSAQGQGFDALQGVRRLHPSAFVLVSQIVLPPFGAMTQSDSHRIAQRIAHWRAYLAQAYSFCCRRAASARDDS